VGGPSGWAGMAVNQMSPEGRSMDLADFVHASSIPTEGLRPNTWRLAGALVEAGTVARDRILFHYERLLAKRALRARIAAVPSRTVGRDAVGVINARVRGQGSFRAHYLRPRDRLLDCQFPAERPKRPRHCLPRGFLSRFAVSRTRGVCFRQCRCPPIVGAGPFRPPSGRLARR